MKKNNEIKINVPVLARVEGDGALEILIKNNEIKNIKLKIFEPPRLFEKFLEGRSYTDIIDIVARICGICPVAYQMSAAHSIENAFQTKPGPWVREMRRLFYCGEWLESHSMHIHFLALPDFLGFKVISEMAKKYQAEVKRGIRLQTYGNDLIKLFGARSVNPVGACVGGFYKAPAYHTVEALLKIAKERLKDAEELIEWLSELSLPDNSGDFTCVSLYHPKEYPFNEGIIVSDKGLNISIDEYENYFTEFQVPYSNALHSKLNDSSYLVGPLSRVNNCFEHLPSSLHHLLQTLKIHFPNKNMHHSILARAIEIYFSVAESIRIMQAYYLPDASYVDHKIQSGVGYGCTEAPRGLLWQKYHFNHEGKVTYSKIVPPTSQNQARIEEDLFYSLKAFGLDKNENDIRHFSEMIIRNYDPCISCSTHFLDLRIIHENN